MGRLRSPWWRFQALIGEKMKMKADDRHLALIDRIISQLQLLKNEKIIESDWQHDNPNQCWTGKVWQIRDLVDELEHIYENDLSDIGKKQTPKLYEKITDQEIKNDDSIKDYVEKCRT
jgi:hypothetical protein